MLKGATGGSRAEGIREMAPYLKAGLTTQEAANILGSSNELGGQDRANAIAYIARAKGATAIGAKAPFLTSVNPSPVPGSDCRQEIVLSGGNFQSGMQVTLTATNFRKTLDANQVSFWGAERAKVEIKTENKTDDWTIVVTNPDGSSSSPLAFRVDAVISQYPIDGQVTQCFGVPWSEKSWKTHTGVDISAAKGTSVPSMTDGEVARVEPLGGEWGSAVVIEESGGMAKGYLHVNPTVSKGEIVKRGQEIGTVWADHLHYNVCTRVKLCWRGALPTDTEDPEHKEDPLFRDGPFVSP